jgi:hypothetical protein
MRQLSAVAPLLGSEGRAARVVFLASTSGRRLAGGRREKGALFRAACPAMACPSPLLVAKGQAQIFGSAGCQSYFVKFSTREISSLVSITM